MKPESIPTNPWSHGQAVLLMMLTSRLRFLAQIAATYVGMWGVVILHSLELLPEWILLAAILLLGNVLLIQVLSLLSFTDIRISDVNDIPRIGKWMFVLPITTRELVLWPMAVGAAFMATAWLVVDLTILTTLGRSTPPTLVLLVVVIGLMYQAAIWLPISAALLRILATLVAFCVPVAVYVWLLKMMSATPLVITGWMAALALLAYLVAWAGVAIDRRGQQIQLSLNPVAWLAGVFDRQMPDLADAFTAQAWFIWRRNGRYIPIGMAVILVPAMIALISLITMREDLWQNLVTLFLAPVWFTMLLGYGLTKPSFWRSEYGLPPFDATRPISEMDLFLVYLWVGAKCLAWLWGLTFGALIIILSVTGLFGELLILLAENNVSLPLAIFSLVLILTAGFGYSLAVVAGNCTLSAAGRQWVPTASMTFRSLLIIFALIEGESLVGWIRNEDSSFYIVILLLAGLGLKGVLTMIAIRKSGEYGMDRTIIVPMLLTWCALVLLSGLTLWSWAPPAHLFWIMLLSAAILTPLAQPAFGPAAIGWDRHR